MDPHWPLFEVQGPDGRRIALDAHGWRHILVEHPEVGPHQLVIGAALRRPDRVDADPLPERARFWRQGAGPSRWLFVVVDFGVVPARVVTAFGRRTGPAGLE